jgi:protoheme IX farnesyltransferase
MKNNHPSDIFRYILLSSTIFVFLGIVLDGVIQSLAITAPLMLKLTRIIIYSIAGAGIILAIRISINRYYRSTLFRWILLSALLTFLSQSALSFFENQAIWQPWLPGLRYTLSLVSGSSLNLATILAFHQHHTNDQKPNLVFSSSFSRQALLALLLVVVVITSGVILSNTASRWACSGWPLCDGQFLPDDLLGRINMLHRFTVFGIGGFMLWFNQRAWRTQRTQRAILTTTTALTVLYFAQGFVGGLKTLREFPIHMLALHAATAAAVITAAITLIGFVGIANRTNEEEKSEALAVGDSKQRIKDFLALTKPIVVTLLLSTTLAGMIIGAKQIPSFGLIIWTMLGGALAAGGSSAVNQYIDRELDKSMTRTAKRPIPSGRMTPAEGLAFGISSLLISFYILAGFVNMFAALLALTGMIYYVIIYSVFLKKSTVQNIVIGGGAGAIPPLVGWAAATGSLNLPAGFLFLIIFLWTPPHFWTLALLKKREYARSGIPMLPVVRGEDETRRQIYFYTIILVITTISVWFFDFAGLLYLIGALILGAYLLILAWNVWKKGRNKVYYRMYRHSNYYLLLLFILLATDALL